MSEHSSIEWTDTTWNPVRGCRKVSPGCKHCYAETFAERWRGIPGHPYEQGFDPSLVPGMLLAPLRWSGKRLVFVNSMSDLFLEDVPDDYVRLVADVMLAANWHTYQVLTKRADRLARLLSGRLRDAAGASHIWWGVSVEDRKHGYPRVDALAATPARVRFLSVEPMLENLDDLPLAGIDWVIVGGESGPGARPIRAEWVRAVRDRCVAMDTRFFFKQWGGVQKKHACRTLDGRTHDAMPAPSAFAEPSKSTKRADADRLDRLIADRYPSSDRAPVVLGASRPGRARPRARSGGA